MEDVMGDAAPDDSGFTIMEAEVIEASVEPQPQPASDDGSTGGSTNPDGSASFGDLSALRASRRIPPPRRARRGARALRARASRKRDPQRARGAAYSPTIYSPRRNYSPREPQHTLPAATRTLTLSPARLQSEG